MEDSVKKFKKRRASRRAARLGVPTVNEYDSLRDYRMRRLLRLSERYDADGDEEKKNNNNNKKGGDSGGHGNTRLPFGLCKRFGIEIQPDWKPRDAWEALAGKGITPDGAYVKLKEGKDPGTPDVTEVGSSEKGKEEAKTPEHEKNKIDLGFGYYKVKSARFYDGEWWLTGKRHYGGGSGSEIPWPLPSEYEKTISGLFQYLKDEGVEEFEDPRTGKIVNPKEMDIPKEPKETATIDDREYTIKRARYSPYSKSWELYGTTEDGRSVSRRYHTKMDMIMDLKDAGLEEFQDPETGELLNPVEMEVPKAVYTTFYPTTRYTELSLGSRGGRYVVMGTDLEGKKKKLEDYSTIADAKAFLKRVGVSTDDVKMSGALKKKEKERTAWTTSDKKEYLEEGGKKYGDLKIEKAYYGSGGYSVWGSDEEGHRYQWRFGGKAEAMDFLKSQGVEKIKDGEKAVNPQEYVHPPILATIRGTDYQSFELKSGPDSLYLYGKDIDGEDHHIDSGYYGYKKFKDIVQSRYGVDIDNLDMDDRTRERLERMKKEDEEKERARKEFEEKAVELYPGKKTMEPMLVKESDSKFKIVGRDIDGDKEHFGHGSLMSVVGELDRHGALDKLTVPDELKDEFNEALKKVREFDEKAVDIGGSRYIDVHLEKSPWSSGTYKLIGTDRLGRERVIDEDDLYGIETDRKLEGKLGEYIKDPDVKQEYEDYRKRLEEFESKAIDIGGRKYLDVKLDYDGDRYRLIGYSKDGKLRRIFEERTPKDVETQLKKYGINEESIEKDESYTERMEKLDRVKKAVESGEYYSFGKDDLAVKDIKAGTDRYGEFAIMGTDVDGDDVVVKKVDTWDDAIEELEKNEIKDYELKDGDDTFKRPYYGMHHVSIVKKPGDSGFLIYADTKRFGKHEIMAEVTSEENARKWLKEHNVNDKRVKTKGMNPNDDVPRTHTMMSLENYDRHRMDRVEEFPMIMDMDDETKKQTADMITEMFDKGAYRMNRSDHFEEIVNKGFKNLLQTGTSGGATSKEGRRITGEKMFGHPYDIPAKEAERYGFWGVDDDKEFMNESHKPGYGKISFKFKKDKVGDRTTYTFGDSLDSGRPLPGYAGKNPTIEGVTGLDEYGSGRKKLNKIAENYKKYKNGEMTFTEFYNETSGMCQDGYVECQYHGPLGIEDVETITFPEYTFNNTFERMNPSDRKEIVTKLKKNGIILNVQDGYDLVNGYEKLKEKFPGEDL